jgi:hypothetical protein
LSFNSPGERRPYRRKPANPRRALSCGGGSGRPPCRAVLEDQPPQLPDQRRAVRQVRRLGGENLQQPALLQLGELRVGLAVDSGGVADDIDQPVQRMQAAEQIDFFSITALSESQV